MMDAIRTILSASPRALKRVILMTVDVSILLAALWISYSLRLGVRFVPSASQLLLMALAPVVALPVFIRMGLYRAVIRYLPERALWTVVQAMSLATLLWVFILFLAEITRFGDLPRSVPVFYWLSGIIFIAGTRFAAKYLLWAPMRRQYKSGEIVIYGAGVTGAQLASALRGQGGRYVAAFLDDDPSLQGREVAGIRVYSPGNLGDLVTDLGVQEVLLSMPSISVARRREIFEELSKYPVKIRAFPAISDLVSGKYLVNQLREIDVDDLLGRSAVPADPQLLGEMIHGKVILVSGAGGSIGSELCRLIVKWSPKSLILLEANEFALYQIERQLVSLADCPVVPILGSVTDEVLVRRALSANGVQAVFHAAAHKHVPLVEANAFEGVRNNVVGTKTLANAALESGVEIFVLISTDKAVRPTNVMGATKRWAEFIVRDCGNRAVIAGSAQRFCAVRFGNVLGSNGSVVPLFKEQIAQGGPVTLTDARMTRYFMSIHEAAELIVQAGALSHGGDVFLLEMGDPVLIRDLAENMVRLAGLTICSTANPGGDIEIVEVGSRPGEKMYEELFYDESTALTTRHPKILRAAASDDVNDDLANWLARLLDAIERQHEADLRKILFEFIAE